MVSSSQVNIIQVSIVKGWRFSLSFRRAGAEETTFVILQSSDFIIIKQ